MLGVIEGKKTGKTVALRADMDALPIQEENDHDFVSENEGVMHACGHDAHAAMLVGAGRLLNGIREELRDCVLHVFQPAEEASPTGGADDEGCGSRSFNWASRLREHALRVRPKLVCGVS